MFNISNTNLPLRNMQLNTQMESWPGSVAVKGTWLFPQGFRPRWEVKEPPKNDGMNQDSKTDFLGAFEKKKIHRVDFWLPKVSKSCVFFWGGGRW